LQVDLTAPVKQSGQPRSLRGVARLLRRAVGSAATFAPLYWSQLPQELAELSPTWANLVSTLALTMLCASRLRASGRTTDLRTELVIQPWLAFGFLGITINIIAAVARAIQG
jgi:hypothetical protein